MQLLGLSQLHLRGVMHRDLKPENILIDKNGKWLIGDLGIALIGSSTDVSEISSTEIIGTEVYMAPEQLKRMSYTSAADIWQLGCVMVELLRTHDPGHVCWTHSLTDWRGYSLDMRTASVQDIDDAVRRSLEAIIADPGARDLLLRVSLRYSVHTMTLTDVLQMTSANPQLRPDPRALLAHWWFKDVDLKNVLGMRAPYICKCAVPYPLLQTLIAAVHRQRQARLHEGQGASEAVRPTVRWRRAIRQGRSDEGLRGSAHGRHRG